MQSPSTPFGIVGLQALLRNEGKRRELLLALPACRENPSHEVVHYRGCASRTRPRRAGASGSAYIPPVMSLVIGVFLAGTMTLAQLGICGVRPASSDPP